MGGTVKHPLNTEDACIKNLEPDLGMTRTQGAFRPLALKIAKFVFSRGNGQVPEFDFSYEKNGFIPVLIFVLRQRGSHKRFRNVDGRSTTVPFHSNRDISPILLRQIVKDIDLTIDEFIRNR